MDDILDSPSGENDQPVSEAPDGENDQPVSEAPDGENDQPVSEAPDGEKKDDARDSERRVVSRRPAKRTRSKKPKRTTRSRTTPVEEKREEPEPDATEDAGQSTEKTADVPEKRVVSRRPVKRSRGPTKSTKRTTRGKAEDKQQSQSEKEAETTVEPVEAAAPVAAPPEPANAMESAEEPVAETTEAAAASPPDAGAGAPAETPAERTQEPPARGASQEHRRTRRRRQPRRQNEGGGPAESRERAERIPQSVVDILTDTWTEEKARKYLSEGFLATLSTPLVSREKVEEIDDEALRDRLKVVRRVLADECMVEDDASDLILLDMVMNALADRLEVYRLTAADASPEKLVQILQLRYNADRRLIDTMTALKNA
jgi:hypothetical protein